MHRCERNKMKQFAAFRCKMRQISAEQDEANRSRLKRFAGVCRRPEEIKRQRWLLYDGPDWCWLTPERFLCIPVWSICGPAGPVNGATTWGHRQLVAPRTIAICAIVAIVDSTAPATADVMTSAVALPRAPIAAIVAVLEMKPDASPAMGSPNLVPSKRTAM